MTLATFFEKFELIAEIPGAIPKLRELVLELAVRGKLVPQDANDETALALLQTVNAERVNLVTAKKIKSRPIVSIKLNEQPYDLPLSWAWARLLEVGYELGQKIPKNRFTYIDVGSIDSKKGCISDKIEQLESNEAPSRARKLLQKGTVIYSTVRPYLLNIAIIDYFFDPEPIASTAFAILHPFNRISNRYLFYWLRSAPFTTYVQENMKGMAYPAINDDKFYNGLIALPPAEEQKRIVAKVDQLMTLLDQLETQQQERNSQQAALAQSSLARFAAAPTPENLQFLFHPSYNIQLADLRKTILSLAVRGKLVPQDENDEPIDSWTASQVTNLEKSKKDKEVQFDLPIMWGWAQLGQVSELINGDRGKNYPNKQEYVREGVPWINAGHIELNGTLAINSMQYITRKKFESLRSGKTRLGDLIYCLRGTLGKTAIITQFQEGAVASSLVIIRLSTVIDPRFAYYFLISPLGREQIFKFDNGSAQPNLSATNVKKYWVPIPPLAEQKRIVAKVDQLLALVDQLEQHHNAARSTAAQLLEAVVRELIAAHSH
ncbi:hypothetical protein CKO12_00710 [Chromatium okenii]|uniref:restriction endonuclease subunit S n=1 Tax=Chromatium okenii TaxID=61644 RepID=UPI0019041A4F|nr:restriction endonuclease subunit S [Chromatium okenii]MBK1640425.1 hypothetical protein [Chromatium okenii]